MVAPAGLAAQAHAVDALGGVVHLGRDVARLLPGRVVGHRGAGGLHQVRTVHRHRALAVERRSEELAAHRQPVADGGQQVVDVVAGIGLDLLQPALLAPDRRLVHADGHDVELAALGGDVGGDALAQNALLERDPLQLDVRVGLLEVLAELLHLDHVAVVHGGDDELGGSGGRAGDGECSERERKGESHACLLGFDRFRRPKQR
jgi:hypothetical protein